MKILILALLAAMAAPAQPAKPACSFVTVQDAESVLGAKATEHWGPGSCAFDTIGKPTILVVIVDSSPNVKQQIWLPKQNIPKAGGTVREEPDVFPGAYSTTIKGAQTIYLLKGNTAVSVTATNDNKGVLPDMLEKMRPVAKRIAGRL